jgi:hypothetical protein
MIHSKEKWVGIFITAKVAKKNGLTLFFEPSYRKRISDHRNKK